MKKDKPGFSSRKCECGKTTIYEKDPNWEPPRKKGSICDRCMTQVTDPKKHGWGICPLEARGAVIGGLNGAMQRGRFYKKDIDKDVKGADLIQPFMKEGNKTVPNPDFVERYGVKNYTPEQKAEIKDKMGYQEEYKAPDRLHGE